MEGHPRLRTRRSRLYVGPSGLSPGRSPGVYTATADVLTTSQLDTLSQRTLRELRHLPAVQRDIIVERILRADPDLGPVLAELIALYRTRKLARRLGPLFRDSISH